MSKDCSSPKDSAYLSSDSEAEDEDLIVFERGVSDGVQEPHPKAMPPRWHRRVSVLTSCAAIALRRDTAFGMTARGAACRRTVRPAAL